MTMLNFRQLPLLVNRNGVICHVAKIGVLYQIWYPVNLLLPEFYENYITEKLGITDAETIRWLQDQFRNDKRESIMPDAGILESHSLRHEKRDWLLHLDRNGERSVTIYLERGVYPEPGNPIMPHQKGYAWGIIMSDDTPETINQTLHCGDLKFARALYKNLWKVMAW
jgi:hypothetical protein